MLLILWLLSIFRSSYVHVRVEWKKSRILIKSKGVIPFEMEMHHIQFQTPSSKEDGAGAAQSRLISEETRVFVTFG